MRTWLKDKGLPWDPFRKPNLEIVCTLKVNHGTKLQYTDFLKRINSPEVQWLGLSASTAGSLSSKSCQGTKILQAVWCDPPRPKQKHQNQTNKNQHSIPTLQSMQEVEKKSCVFVQEWQRKILEEITELGKSPFCGQKYTKFFRQASLMDSETTR